MTATNKVASCASMSVPSIGQKRLIIMSTTGMVGNVVRPGFYIGRVVPQNSEHRSISRTRVLVGPVARELWKMLKAARRQEGVKALHQDGRCKAPLDRSINVYILCLGTYPRLSLQDAREYLMCGLRERAYTIASSCFAARTRSRSNVFRHTTS
jgi:hypothetical protein